MLEHNWRKYDPNKTQRCKTLRLVILSEESYDYTIQVIFSKRGVEKLSDAIWKETKSLCQWENGYDTWRGLSRTTLFLFRQKIIKKSNLENGLIIVILSLFNN